MSTVNFDTSRWRGTQAAKRVGMARTTSLYFRPFAVVPAPPTIGNFSPPLGTPIATGATVTFDVTAPNNTISEVVISNAGELVFDGTAFTTAYSQSTKAALADGWRFSLRRQGGWPSSGIALDVRAIDRAGQVTT